MLRESFTILMIEDSPTQAEIVSRSLSAQDIDVVIANSGEQGLRLVEVNKPDLIVLDINLPGMDGYQVCKRIKRDTKTRHIPVIMLTSEDTTDAHTLGLKAGADDFISKGEFAIELLLQKLFTNYEVS